MKTTIIKIISSAAVITVLFSLSACTAILRPDTPDTSNTTDVAVNSTEAAETTETAESNTEELNTDPQITEMILDDSEEVAYEELCQFMKQYPNLELMRADNLLLSADEYISLCEMNKNVTVITKVDFEGTVIDLSETQSDISGKVIGDKAKFDILLSHIPEGFKLIMCDCGYTDDEMGALREKYTSLEFVWRIYMGKWSIRTDDEAFSVMIYDDNYVRLTSEDIKVLKYCTNMYALDLGHQAITDLSTIGEMTDLRVLILADNQITDLSPLSNLKNLQYLELFVNRIWDISPLASCTNLVDLNFGWNSVYDLSSIYSLEKIERLWLPTTKVPEAKRDEITANFPHATIIFEDVNSISSGWRTHERYFSMRGMFTNNKYDPNFVK